MSAKLTILLANVRKPDVLEEKVMSTPIKSILKQKGIKQNKLAEILGLSCNSISKKINGKAEFKASELMKIASFLEVDISALFFEGI